LPKQVTPYQAADRTKKDQVEEMFDNIAHNYDFLNHLLSAGIDHIWRKRAIKFLKPGNPKVIMDMATGTGDFAMEALKLNPDRVVGLDLSEDMLKYGRIKADRKGVSDIVEYVKGDSENLQFDDNTFDAMTVGFGVRNFEHLEKGLSEMLRVLKPGGKLVVLEISKPTAFPVKQLFKLYFHYVCPLIGRAFSKDHRAYTYLPESVEAFPHGQAFLDILNKVGYKNAVWTPLTFGICAMYTCEK
jgi:demethylmenaquinone methyltransferase/2-methoxy-6-polyprenyl-1,4-benzoquinol methylase